MTSRPRDGAGSATASATGSAGPADRADGPVREPDTRHRGGGPGERTSLSWQRSELAVALVAALVAGAALRLDVIWVAVAAGTFALAGVAVAIAGRPREVRLGQDDTPPWPWLPRIALATAGVGLLGAALGLVELVRRLQ